MRFPSFVVRSLLSGAFPVLWCFLSFVVLSKFCGALLVLWRFSSFVAIAALEYISGSGQRPIHSLEGLRCLLYGTVVFDLYRQSNKINQCY